MISKRTNSARLAGSHNPVLDFTSSDLPKKSPHTEYMAFFENIALELVSTQKKEDSPFNFIDIVCMHVDFNTLLTII